MKRRRRTLLPGQMLTAAGQQFLCVRVGHVRSRRGRFVPVLIWASTCAEPGCGLAFEQTTCRKPRPVDMRPCCRAHLETRPERRARRQRAALRAWKLASLVTELPDGRCMTLASEVLSDASLAQ